MPIVKIAHADVAAKIDLAYVTAMFPNLHHVGVTFLCTPDDEGDDEWIDESGRRQLLIQLPYEEVKRLDDVRPLMVAKLRERLGRVA